MLSWGKTFKILRKVVCFFLSSFEILYMSVLDRGLKLSWHLNRVIYGYDLYYCSLTPMLPPKSTSLTLFVCSKILLPVIILSQFLFWPSLSLPLHLRDPHTALTKEGDMERLCSTHHSSSSIASSSQWSPSLPCPSGRSCCQCLLRILIMLYLFVFVCSYVVFLSINSAGKSTKNANSQSHSLESELSHSTPSSVLCKLRLICSDNLFCLTFFSLLII